ncbi:disintegrin and metalloproteinase domain-containing protein 1a-like [Macrotis lagotis]|uniref:disintegrin and metalloproteinase domain-containing protein 1a-like n=1 Tax=Macrotis lagotis TaxID=92651 RepID=UPI003D6887B5
MDMDEEEREFSLRVPWMWEWDLGLGSSHFRIGFFLLLILALLPGNYCALGSIYYSSYEIVIPKRLTSREGEERAGKISYSIFMKGKNQVIHLKQKRGMFAKNFPIYTYSDGKLSLDMPFLPDDCYFDGYVESNLKSLVSLSTCSGLKGIITIDKNIYNIEPIDASGQFEHVLYQIKKDSSDFCLGPKTASIQFKVSADKDRDPLVEQFLKKRGFYIWSHLKYLKMFLVVDNNRFQKWNRNVTKTTQMVMDVIAHANTHLIDINTKLILIGLEIWSQKNQIHIPHLVREILPVFNRWRTIYLFDRAPHDIAHLIIGHDPGNIMGDAYYKGACVYGYAAAVETFFHEDSFRFSRLMSHELGHNLGMLHDTRHCVCYEHFFCIMYEYMLSEGLYSNCSKEDYYEFLKQHEGSCLYNRPELKKVVRLSVCGNKVLDRGEECDCGSVETCAHDPCCLPTCRMTKGSVCAFGSCCQGCRFQSRGTVCRPSMDECDLPEYCNGTSKWCQPDVYKQDGTPCGQQGFCYEGRCRSLNQQCVEIFGKGARSARDSCYQLMNTKADRFGNCGCEFPDYYKVFRKCPMKDIKCGRLMCENVQMLPQTKEHHTLIQVPHEDTWCWGADLFVAIEEPDRGEVSNGTVCGQNKICLNYVCSDASLIRLQCNPATKCHGRGVCNNLKHCHCNSGYAPPTCEAAGNGGSIDSGPPPSTTTITTTTTQNSTITPTTATNLITTTTTQQHHTTITTQPPSISPNSSVIIITPSSRLPRRVHKEQILAIFFFLLTFILLVNSIIWYFIICPIPKIRI